MNPDGTPSGWRDWADEFAPVTLSDILGSHQRVVEILNRLRQNKRVTMTVIDEFVPEPEQPASVAGEAKQA